MKINDKDLKYMIDHVFLPPKLPQKYDSETHRKDSLLLDFVGNASKSFADLLAIPVDGQSSNDLKLWSIILKMLKNMRRLYADDGGIVRDELEASLQRMDIDGVLPVFVEAQNAGIVFRKIAKDVLTFEAFEVSPPSDVVMGNCAKISMRFPANPRLPFPAEKTVLSTLANVLAHLSTSFMEEAIPFSKKGGEEHHEVRNTASPRFITEALAGIIRATPPTRRVTFNTVYVQKRLDDHVLWKNALKPWRRSSTWLLIRVAMQTTSEEWGAGNGRDYKTFQAFLMASLLEMAISGDPERFTCNLLDSMRAKVVRRLCKLGELIEDFTLPTLRIAADAVRHASRTIEQRWGEVRRLHESTVQWAPPSPESLGSSTAFDFTFPNSRDFLLELIRRHDSPEPDERDFDCGKLESTLRLALPPKAQLSPTNIPDITDDDIETSLINFEAWVETHLAQWEKLSLRTETDSLTLSSAIDAYREKACAYYKGSPERISLMHLCILELWAALDRICTKWCPLLQEYSPGIAQNVADPLVLPYFSQMRRLERFQMYLGHRNQHAQEHGDRSVFRLVNAKQSFHNKYFDLPAAAPLLALERKITADSTSRKADTISKLQAANAKYKDLMRQAEAQDCVSIQVDEPGGRRWRHRMKRCPKCQLTLTARNLRVVRFEEHLPEDILMARPIIFELRCPMPFAIWRDTTMKIIISILGVEPKPHKDLYSLQDYAPLEEYFCPSYKGRRINFASTTKSLKQSHYGDPCSVPTTESNVLFGHKGKFTVFDVTADEGTDAGFEGNLRSTCTFQIDGMYAPLQLFVNDTRHAPNSVVAAVSNTPLGLSTTEFINFGLLRAGNCIQWRNIMKAIRSQNLSFTEPAIFALVAQSVWQAGPIGHVSGGETLYREAHIDHLDEDFGMQVAEELLRTLQSLGDNWKQANFLAILVVLALRAQAFTPHPAVRCHIQGVLSEVRNVSLRWIKMISTSQSLTSGGDSKQGSEELKDHKAQAMAKVAVVLRASFDAECDDYSGTFRSSSDAVKYIYAGILISAVHTRSFSPSLKLLASRNQRLSLRVEPHLIRACHSDRSILQDVVREAWPQYLTGSQWSPVSLCRDHWWTSVELREDRSISQTFHMNVVDGTFLIDGMAFDQLPVEYGSNPIYIAVFKDHVFRAVRPSSIAGMRYQSHYGIYEVHFNMTEHRLMILRRNSTTGLQEYIPSESINHDLPSIFSTDHCFWYSSNAHTISILPLSHAWASDAERHWTVDLKSCLHTLVGRLEKKTASGVKGVVDLRSEIHRSLVQTLGPLEPNPQGIVVTALDADTATISVHLPRHDLSFVLQQNELRCLSVPGYVVDINLSGIGCLFGLTSILNLRHSDLRQPRRKIIVPKGSMLLKPAQYGHVDISIDLGDSKGYFIYDVDNLIGRLVGTRTMESDLYLVRLHAFATSSQRDPLTERTGTDEALDRLASAATLSFHAISKESRSYLDDITALTPVRSFYPAHLRVMETIQWTKHLPTSAQRPEFHSRVARILQSWREMEAFLHLGDLAREPEYVEGMEHLISRAAHRDWIHSSSVVSKGHARDCVYTGRDSLTDSNSRGREKSVFQAASLACKPFTGILPCRNLHDAMSQWGKVTGAQTWGWDSIENWLSSPTAAPIADTWCTFYELCRHLQSPRFDVSVALAFQSFRGVPLDLIGTLRALMSNPHFSSPAFKLPQCSTFELANGSTFNRESLLWLVKDREQSFKESDEYQNALFSTENDSGWEERAQKLYRNALEMECNRLMDEFSESWPAPPRRPLRTSLRLLKPLMVVIEETIRPLLSSWSQNRDFLSSIQRLQDELENMPKFALFSTEYAPSHSPSRIRSPRSFTTNLENLMAERTPSPAYTLTMDPLPMSSNRMGNRGEFDVLRPLLQRLRSRTQNVLQTDYVGNLEASLEAYKTHLLQTDNGYLDRFDEDLFESFRSLSMEHCQLYLKQVRQFLRPNTVATQLMQEAGIWPAVTTRALLQCLSLNSRRALSPSWSRLLTFHAISVHEVKRMSRMLQLARADMRSLLESELQYRRAWDPSEHPDWLLVEIESDLSVRPVQAAIAKEMLKPKSDLNSVMQLNMGEGKSSVIVPIVAASASIGSNLCRVVVLGPQMKQQFQVLRQTITGLCNRRIIYLPFNRKVNLDPIDITRIHEFLRKAVIDGAIWICEPEHIMSLKLLALDQLVHAGVRNLVDLHLWLHDNSKDILDESDEILHARQQVIYTVGSQKSLDAAPARWEVVQKLLGLLATYLVQQPCGQDNSSFLVGDPPNITAFPIIRIQSDAAREELLRFMENSLQNHDWPLPPHMSHLVTKFVTMSNPSEDDMRDIHSYCLTEDARVMQTILILRGLISCDILMHSLKEKRWRVQYGLDLQRSKLAVPFRAKDSPSPRSEFGHPDVTILLTCLSYYYAGLDPEMVRHVLQSLLSSEAPDLIYADWLKPCWGSVPIALRTIKGLNLQDESLLHDQIYPLLRHNKAVIDFYLNIFIFPTYAQEFPRKMSTSGWDIAITKPNLTTGFSGTNDGRLLLPVTITQTDQDAQLHTNAKVLSYILRKENSVEQYPTFLSSIDLLHRIRHLSPEPTVILDVGAQILDLSNIEFSKHWLATYRDDSTIKAAVFFDEGNNLLVLTPDGVTQPLIGSPYSSRLKECLVYLDDSHTRGTDLRIPLNKRAAVTLGPKLTKDKLVQGCMRMRKLGEGHSLVFMASDEVVSLIRNTMGLEKIDPTTEDVMIWSIQETWQQLQANLPAWVLQGHSFIRREEAWRDFSRGNLVSSKDVSDGFCETEARSLEELYGSKSVEAAHWVWKNHSVDSKDEAARKIAQRCRDFNEFTLTDAGVHEEMEIELVHEKEVEREVERAPDAEPAQHKLHANVVSFVTTGNISLCREEGFRNAAKAFSGTSFEIPKDFNDVFQDIVVTNDFWHTIQLPSGRSTGDMDNFMRSVDWVVTANSQTKLMVLLSPYEVNQLLPKFRTSTRVKLHMFAPYSNLAVPSFDDLNFLTLPSTPNTFSLPYNLTLQLNLFSGSLYFRDYKTYQDVCRILGLHFGCLPEHLKKPSVINANFFVLDPQAREELKMGSTGFKENALPFFQNMIRMRRFGRGFGPSHIGKILHGTRLKKKDFVGGVL